MNLPPSIWGIAAISLASLFFQIKAYERLTKFLYWLFFVNIGLFVLPGVNEDASVLVLSLIIFSSILFLLSALTGERFKTKWLRLIFPVFFLILLLWLNAAAKLVFFSETHSFANKFLIASLVLVAFGTELSRWKLKLISKLSGSLDSDEVLRIFQLFVLAVGIFLASFGAGSLGIYAVAFVFLSTSFFRKESDSFLVLIPLLFSIIPVIGHLSGIDSSVYFQADVLAAFIMGVFIAGFAHILRFDKGRPLISVVLLLLMTLSLPAAMTMLGAQFELLGGADALIAMLIGIVLAGGVIGKGFIPITVLGVALFAGLISLPAIDNNQAVSVEMQKDAQSELPRETEVFLPLDELIGTYPIVSDSSLIDFRIGPKMQTKGAIQGVKGKFVFSEATKLSVDLELSVDKLTTFNRMRDEELMGPLYFNTAVFPKMKFKSTGLKKLSENEYELSGNFNMLGKTNPETLTIHRVESNGILFKGKGLIDRTKYGMEPNSSEGNLVEYTFYIVLSKSN